MTSQVWLGRKKLLIIVEHFFEVFLRRLDHSRICFAATEESAATELARLSWTVTQSIAYCLNNFSYASLKMLVSKYEYSTDAACSSMARFSGSIGANKDEFGYAYLAIRYLQIALDSNT